MILDLSPEMEAQLKAKAEAEGVSVGTYVERLVSEEESRQARLEAFHQSISDRLASLARGETADGEEVMDRLIAELNSPGHAHTRQ